MFHVHFSAHLTRVEEALIHVMDKYNLGISPYVMETQDKSRMFEMHLGDRYSDTPREIIENCFCELNKQLS